MKLFHVVSYVRDSLRLDDAALASETVAQNKRVSSKGASLRSSLAYGLGLAHFQLQAALFIFACETSLAPFVACGRILLRSALPP